MRKLVITTTALTMAAAGIVAAAPAQAGVPWLVTVKANTTQVTLGHAVTFTGRVTPAAAAAGHQVTLQVKAVGKPWKSEATKTVGAAGRYHLSVKPTVNTARQYRVVMPTTSQHARGVSPAVRVKVYGWSKLYDHAAVNADGMDRDNSINLNGVTYPKSIGAFWTDQTSIEFNLDHRCVALKGTFGIDDDSETGAQSTVTALADGTQVYTHTFLVGQKAVKQVAIDSPLKLKLTALSVVPQVSGYGAVGTPQVLCTR